MRIQFPMSTLTKLRSELRANPEATGVVLTNAELCDVYEELLSDEDSNCVMLSGPNRCFRIDGRTIQVTKEPT